MHRKIRPLLVVALSFVVSACFLNSLLYKHIDWIVQYQVDRYFDLDKDQKKVIEVPISETVAWFKRERMVEVVAQLRAEFDAVKAHRLDPQSSDRWAAIVDENRRLIVERLLSVSVAVAVTLKDDQIDHLAKMIERSNKALRRAVEGTDADFQDHLEDFADSSWDRFEYLMGPLRDDQKSLVIKEMGWTRDSLSKELAIRQGSIDFWTATLKSRDPAIISLAIRRANNLAGVSDPTDSYKFYQVRAQDWKRVRDKLASTIDAKQWLHMEQKVRDILDEVQRLANTAN